jgi:hypothetical protein
LFWLRFRGRKTPFGGGEMLKDVCPGAAAFGADGTATSATGGINSSAFSFITLISSFGLTGSRSRFVKSFDFRTAVRNLADVSFHDFIRL